MVDQAGGVPPGLCRPSSPVLPTVAAPLFEDDDLGESRSLTDTASTDTDGSSLHTPTSPAVSRHSRPGPVDRLSPSSAYSAEDLATYVALS